MGFELSIDTSRLASWTFSFGGDIFDYKANKFTLNSDAAVNSMKFLQDLFVNGCAALPTEAYGDQTDFGNGTLLFAIGSTSGLSFYDAAAKAGAKQAWSVAAMPHTTKDPMVNIYGASVSMPKTTPERQLAAWIFLKYFTTTDVQVKWSIATGYFPVVKSAEAGLADFFAANPGMKAVYSLIPFGKFEPPVPGYDFVREKVNLALAKIADPKGPDPKGVLDALNDEANIILADQLAQIK
jgi:multiple sugar transport system substrate-binding protein